MSNYNYKTKQQKELIEHMKKFAFKELKLVKQVKQYRSIKGV